MGPNSQFGGVQEGFLSFGYHVLTLFCVKTEPKIPPARGMAIATESPAPISLSLSLSLCHSLSLSLSLFSRASPFSLLSLLSLSLSLSLSASHQALERRSSGLKEKNWKGHNKGKIGLMKGIVVVDDDDDDDAICWMLLGIIFSKYHLITMSSSCPFTLLP